MPKEANRHQITIPKSTSRKEEVQTPSWQTNEPSMADQAIMHGSHGTKTIKMSRLDELLSRN
jgi:hypothetical protein